MNCAKAKEIDFVDYLASLGHYPAKRPRGGDYFYLSPLRQERNPSFHVDRKKNVWFDHGGDTTGGTIVDFGIAYHKCTVSEFLAMLDQYVSFHPHSLIIKEPNVLGNNSSLKEKKIFILSTFPVRSPALIAYCDHRKVPIVIVQQFCCEVVYKLYERVYYAIGFKNDKGGYELRNPRFKASSQPKAITFFNRGFSSVEVFEGFFSFLSFLTLAKNWQDIRSNFIILNSLSFLTKRNCELMERHDFINLHLDRDKQGTRWANELQSRSVKYRNASVAYRGYKDWNQYLISNWAA